MTALAIERPTAQMDRDPVPHLLSIGVKAAAKIYAGALVAIEASSGFAKPATGAIGLIVVGRAEATADNTSGANGAIQVQVRLGANKWANSASTDLIASTNVGQVCYAVDDQTVALTHNGGTRSPAGRIIQVDTDGVWVLSGLGFADPTQTGSAPLVQTGTLTLVAGTKTQNTLITITATSKVYVSLNTPGGGTQGVKYKVPDASLVTGAPGVGAFAVTAVDAAGATVATDVSTINYLIVG